MSTAESFDSEEGALLRSRLHIRGGKRRLRQGKISAGIVTLYDAAMFGLLYYILSPEHRAGLMFKEGEDLKDDYTAFRILRRSGVIDSGFDYGAFNALVEKAMEQEMPDYDYRGLLSGFEHLMTQLGVMPFDEDSLPPEDPKTY